MHAPTSALAVILVALLGLPIVTQQQFPGTATIRGENVWLRTDPARETEILAYLQRGESIRVTGDAVPADGDAFYPVEVISTGQTGWVRVLFVNPRSFASIDVGPTASVETPAADVKATKEEPPRQRKNRTERPARDAARPAQSSPTATVIVASTPAVADAVTPAPIAPPAAAEATAMPGDSPETAAPAGAGVIRSGVGAVVSDGVFRDEVGSFSPAAGHKLLEISVRIRNRSAQSQTFSPANFQAQDVASSTQFDSVLIDTEVALSTVTLPPDDLATGKVFFEVPQAAAHLVVTFDPDPNSPDTELYWRVP
jgi:hypothetical protein